MLLLAIALLAAICWAFDSAFVEPARSTAAQGALDQYLTTKTNGSADDLCTQADTVKQAYSQKGDEAGYEEWNAVQRSDCAHAHPLPPPR